MNRGEPLADLVVQLPTQRVVGHPGAQSLAKQVLDVAAGAKFHRYEEELVVDLPPGVERHDIFRHRRGALVILHLLARECDFGLVFDFDELQRDVAVRMSVDH